MDPEFTFAVSILGKQLLDRVKKRLLGHPRPGPAFYDSVEKAAKSLKFVADQLDDIARRYRDSAKSS